MLRRIVEEKKKEVIQLQQTMRDIDLILEETGQLPSTRPFIQPLLNSHRPISIIAEVKKASPSKGLIRPDFDPLQIAESYKQAGVEAMSVLTDEPFFMGSKNYLRMIRQEVNTPLLRKDFMIDPLQVYEARLIGADCILLIAAILEPNQLAELNSLAKQLNLDVLIEVHNREELEMVFESVEPSIIGINNRNLKTFETSLQTTEELMAYIPSSIPVVSESGIHTAEDIRYLQHLGVRSVLVGEHFMRQTDIRLAVEELVGR
jgi:indole-3-glycerol phosphate synthase